MHSKNLIASALFSAAAFGFSSPASAQVLTGDVRLACEAVLCLATGVRPAECAASLRRYFSISYRYLTDTIRGRVNFLSLCPAANETPQMSALITAMANGAGRCDAMSLNATLRTWNGNQDNGYVYVSNAMPNYCTAYTSQAYTNFAGNIPRYVGTPERGGFWAEAQDYAQALAEYNARIAAEEAERSRGDSN